jgi:diguanylate cyclase (GGDEF)-like protein
MKAQTALSRPKRSYLFELFLLALFAATIVAMVSYEKLFKQTFIINTESEYHTWLTDDRPDNGGNSIAIWKDKEQKIWSCDLAEGYLYYYCLLTIELTNSDRNEEGLDLSLYQEVTIHYDYQSEQDDTLRVQIRNFNPEFSTADNFLTRKYNEFEFRPSEFGNRITIELDKFYVPSWWIAELRLPSRLAEPNFDNVTQIEIQTGTKDQVGLRIVQIKEIIFTGKSIDAETYYLSIIVIWLVSLTILGLIRFTQIVRDLRFERRHLQTLTQENEALELKKAELEKRVHVDKLTTVYNRAGIEQAFTVMHHNWTEKTRKYGIIVLDLDHFKIVNDDYGHQIGDVVLEKLGAMLKATVRSEDLVGRWGGEEFIVLANAAEIEQLRVLAEKVRFAVESAEWPESLKITASLGLAIVNTTDTIESIFTRADSHLYRAKNHGRNNVQG